MPIPGAISPIDGTGLLGSLRYSSKPLAAGAVIDSFPPASRYKVRAAAFFGGHDSKRCHSLRPVSNKKAFGTLAPAEALRPVPLPFKLSTKNASSMFSWKYSEVGAVNLRLPSMSPLSRAHPPCRQGPMTSVSRAMAPFFCSDVDSLKRNETASASNQPPTHITSEFMFFIYGECARNCQYPS